ncbi:hypothetical protein ScPMuIL_012889 [Solemya velum]
MRQSYSMRSPAVKRLMKEAQELHEPTEQYFTQPLEDNLFEWHFTIRGPVETEFDGGIYHGRIVLPPDYPMKPPSIIFLTPNGRFEIYKKICLSISGHHPESWQPSWSIRTALLAIIGFMPTHGAGAIGSLDYKPEERKKLAKKTQEWKCSTCGDVTGVLKPVTEASEKTRQEAKELATQIAFQGEKEKKTGESTENSSSVKTSVETPTATTPSPPSTSTPPFMQNMPYPFPPGTLPFNRFPFPPPFMNMPNFASNQSNSRFPPPHAPFFPPMFPPGFQPQAGGAMPMPPWSNSHGFNHISTSSEKAPQPPTQSQQAPNVQKTSQSAPEPQTTVVSPDSPSTSTTQASSSTQNSTEQAAAPVPPTPSVVPVTRETTVRHRVTENPNVSVRENLSQRAELHHNENRQQSGGTVTLVLIVALGLMISLLLLYRLYNSKIFDKFFPS